LTLCYGTNISDTINYQMAVQISLSERLFFALFEETKQTKYALK